MYIPKLYNESDQKHIISFIKENSFATLIATIEDRPVAVHIPLYLHENNGDWSFTGHIARPNPIGKAFDGKTKLLAIFHGPHTYISSSWYDHVNVPTWNYQTIHVYGTARSLNDDAATKTLLDLVGKYEADIPDGLDWKDLPDEVASALRGIIAFEMKVEKIEAKSKLSQNRKDKDYFNIIKQLKKREDFLADEIADEMEKRRSKN